MTGITGSEHQCRYRAGDDRWEKATHRNLAGWWIDFEDMRCVPARPLEYLCRLELVNDEFDDDLRLERIEIGPDPNDCRIVTSQPHVTGETPTPEYLAAWLASYAFEHVREHQIGAYDAACFRRGDLWLFDVRPANFVFGHDERCYPIDVIVQHAPHGHMHTLAPQS